MHCHNDNSVRGLTNAAENLTLQRILESSETISLSKSATRERKYARVITKELITDADVSKIRDVVKWTTTAIFTPIDSVIRNGMMKPLWEYFDELMKEDICETRVNSGINLFFNDLYVPNASV